MRSVLRAACLLILLAQPAWAAPRPPGLSADVALLIDPDGQVVYAKNAAGDHAPASLVKMMTLYLAYEALEWGRAHWDDPVTVSRRAAETPRYRMGLRPGEEVPLSVLLEGVAIASANDAATAVAEHLAGTEEEFVERMNAKARALGLAHTRFANAHGLPDPAQRTTAEDMAELLRHLLQDHPGARTVLGGRTFIYRARVYGRSIPLFDNPGGIQALKTGFTREAGYNLAIAAWRDDQPYLLVVMGSQSRSLSFRDARKLLYYGFGDPRYLADDEPAPRPKTATWRTNGAKGRRAKAPTQAGIRRDRPAGHVHGSASQGIRLRRVRNAF